MCFTCAWGLRALVDVFRWFSRSDRAEREQTAHGLVDVLDGDGVALDSRIVRSGTVGTTKPCSVQLIHHAAASFGWKRSLGHLEDERLRGLPDAPVLKCPCVGHGSVADKIE